MENFKQKQKYLSHRKLLKISSDLFHIHSICGDVSFNIPDIVIYAFPLVKSHQKLQLLSYCISAPKPPFYILFVLQELTLQTTFLYCQMLPEGSADRGHLREAVKLEEREVACSFLFYFYEDFWFVVPVNGIPTASVTVAVAVLILAVPFLRGLGPSPMGSLVWAQIPAPAEQCLLFRPGLGVPKFVNIPPVKR